MIDRKTVDIILRDGSEEIGRKTVDVDVNGFAVRAVEQKTLEFGPFEKNHHRLGLYVQYDTHDLWPEICRKPCVVEIKADLSGDYSLREHQGYSVVYDCPIFTM